VKDMRKRKIIIDYIESPPCKWTFKPPKVRRWVERHLEGRVLNLFAGKTKLRHSGEIIRNDIDPEIEADYHFDAIEVDKYFPPNSFDTVIIDPPYTYRKSKEKYRGRWYEGKLKIVKDKVARLIKPGGICITFGYDTTGMGRSRGFRKERILIINHGGDHRDTLAVIERKVYCDLEGYQSQ